MELPRFFYSTDGTDAHGPVTEDELRQLYQAKVIGAASYLCREGETEWQPLNPEALQPKVVTPTRQPPYEPPPYVPTPAALARMKMPPMESESESGIGSAILTGIWLVVAIGGAILLTILTPAPGGDAARVAGYHAGTFTAELFIIGLIPHLLAKLAKGFTRVVVRTVLAVGFALLILVGKLNNPALRLEAEANALNQQTQADARKQIAEKGYYDGNIQQAEANVQKMKDQASQDNSEASRLTRAALGVSQELIGKVKLSEEAEKACGSFDPATLNSLDDITSKQSAITKLRATQSDALAGFQSYDDHCRAALATGDFSQSTINEFVAGAHKGGHIDQVIVIWKLKIKLSDDHLARLDFLAKNWGVWNTKDGKLLFTDDSNLQAYDTLTEALQHDVAQIKDLQKQMFQ